MAVHYSGKAHLSGKVLHGPRLQYDVDALSLFSAMTEAPDAIRKGVINNVIVDLKGAGIWAKMDGLWMLAAHTEQAGLLNWITRSGATKISTPTFATDRGFIGGAGKAIDTGIVMNAANRMSQNSASLGGYCRTNATSTGGIDIGASDGTTANQTYIQFFRSGTNILARVNNLANNTNGTISDPLGLITADRSGINSVTTYKNGTSVGSSANASSGVPGYSMYLLASNQAGAIAGAFTRQQAMSFLGESLNVTEHAALYTIVQAYMTAIGANV